MKKTRRSEERSEEKEKKRQKEWQLKKDKTMRWFMIAQYELERLRYYDDHIIRVSVVFMIDKRKYICGTRRRHRTTHGRGGEMIY